MFSYKKLKNKIFISSSNITDNAACIDVLFQYGAAGVITKTIASFEDRKTTGRVWKKGRNLYNSTGYSGKGLLTWLDILSKYRRENKIVIPSIYAYEKAMLWKMTRLLQQIQVPAIEIGMSCPNDAKKNSSIIMPDHIAWVIKDMNIPIYIKLCAQTESTNFMKELCSLGISGLVLSDSFPGYLDHTKTQQAGISGECIREKVLRSINLARDSGISCEIVGTGGIFTREHVAEYLRSGADAVGLCSCMYIYGINYVKSIMDK